MMKRALLFLAAVVLLVPHAMAQAQEKYPQILVPTGKGPYSFPKGYVTPFDKVEMKVTEKMSPNLDVIHGSSGIDLSHPDASGGRMMILFGPDGVLMVDTNNRQTQEKTLAVIRSVTDGPLKVLVNTHIHSDHTGGNAFFAKQGARWFHTGGIFCALSESTPDVALEAMQAARRAGVVVSYDLNYRPSLWKSIGGKAKAQEVNRKLAPYVDVMIGNEEDFSASLGFEIEGVDSSLSHLPIEAFKKMILKVTREFPFKVVATTLRAATTASNNDWSAICYADGEFHQAMERKAADIMDRVGGGDSFASGLIYGFLTGRGPAWAVECGAAHGALAMTTPGDTSMATLDEVLQAMKGGSARIAR